MINKSRIPKIAKVIKSKDKQHVIHIQINILKKLIIREGNMSIPELQLKAPFMKTKKLV